MHAHFKPNRRMMQKFYLFILWLIHRKTAHGYEMLQMLKKEGMPVATASRLYPLLNQMLVEGLISHKEEKHGKRIRKVYHITPKGRKMLQDGKKMFHGLMGEYLREMIR